MPRVAVIAIVDDDAAIRASLGGLIRSHGFGADLFASGEELLRSPGLADTSCVVTDVQMPGMSGLELQRLLHTRRRALPIVFITGHPKEQTRRDALAAGAVGFFTKPFDGAVLIACIKNALSGMLRTGH